MTNRPTRPFLLVVLLLALGPNVFGCLNPIGSSTVSVPIHVEGLNPEEFLAALITHPGKTHWLGVLGELKLEDVRSPLHDQVSNRNNTAVAMLHVGMVERAIAILEELERTNPGRYYTAANLGTAYELNGQNEKALEWIKEGIKRDPDAHNGSEWLHVNILEAKLALEKDPNWLASNSVIGLHRLSEDQLSSGGPVAIGNRGEGVNLQQVEEALIYQLHERLEFIKPPEAVVANLLFDLSRTLARTRRLEHSAVIREFAHIYGQDLMPWSAPEPELPAVAVPTSLSTSRYWIGGASVLVAFVVAIMLIFWQRRRVTGRRPR